MKAYIVIEDIPWEGKEIYGVFSSKKKAEEFIESYKGSKYFPTYDHLEIEEWKVE